ncbi:MAG TPA: hypothetical protein ENN57_03525 [Chloroflexi bacterium]|nr:hypothetical protein [Chloroflexota bacterium]
MKGRYNGRTMNVYGKDPGYGRLASIPVLSKKAKGLPRCNRGDLVQLDTLDIRPLPGEVLKQFTARDVI